MKRNPLELFVQDVLYNKAQLLYTQAHKAEDSLPVAALGWSSKVRAGFKYQRVFKHQADAFRALQDGQHLILTTPTASGKTGAYFPALFSALEKDPQATALLVYPLVALAQDQREKLFQFRDQGQFPWQIASFEGSKQAADIFGPNVRMVTATPDKLHWSLTQKAIQPFLAQLKYVVLDEAHTYRGGFGSEVSGFIRRILALAHSLGARPQVVLSSATVGNPAEFAEELSGVRTQEIAVSGAPQYQKNFYLADHFGQPYRFWESVVANSAVYGLKILAFFRGRGRAMLLHEEYRSRYPKHVHLYLAGASAREERLSRFREAKSGVMFATNALEAGVDIGDLQVVILDGYPGSRMAFRQMAGRCGRISAGAVLYLPATDERGILRPADAFYSLPQNFSALLTGDVEKAVVERANRYIAPKHAGRLLEEHQAARVQPPSPEQLFGVSPQYKPSYWTLRGSGSAEFYLIEESMWQRDQEKALHYPLETPSEHYARIERHIGALFTLEGQSYTVRQWHKIPQGIVILAQKRTQDLDFITRGDSEVQVLPQQMSDWQHFGDIVYRYGWGEITRRYLGYQTLRQVSQRICRKCDRLPAASWQAAQCPHCGGRIVDQLQNQKISESRYVHNIASKPFQTGLLEVGVQGSPAIAHTLKHVLRKLIPEAVACDQNDLGGAFRGGRDDFFFLYDDWAGGLGITRRTFGVLPNLLKRAAQLCAQNCCKEGGFCCTETERCDVPFLSNGERRPLNKAATAAFLAACLEKMATASPT